MTCKMCHHHFCWLCLKDWDGNYNCQNQTIKTNVVIDDNMMRSSYIIERYDHHVQAETFAQKQLSDLITEMGIQDTAIAFDDAEELRDKETNKAALEQVVKCRHVIKYTFALQFFMGADHPQKLLLEDFQNQLIEVTERLSYLTENHPDVVYDRAAVANLTSLTRQYLENLLLGIDETIM